MYVYLMPLDYILKNGKNDKFFATYILPQNKRSRGNYTRQSAWWSCYELETKFRARRHGAREADCLLVTMLCTPSSMAASLSQALPESQKASPEIRKALVTYI